MRHSTSGASTGTNHSVKNVHIGLCLSNLVCFIFFHAFIHICVNNLINLNNVIMRWPCWRKIWIYGLGSPKLFAFLKIEKFYVPGAYFKTLDTAFFILFFF